MNVVPTTENPVVPTLDPADAPPEGFGPRPPPDFAPRFDNVLVRGRNPTHGQLLAAPAAVAQILEGSNYRDWIGGGVPESDLASALYAAYGWSMTARNVRAYLEYVRIREAAAWSHAWSLLDVVRPIVISVCKVNTTAVTAFSALIRFFDIRSAISRKGHATRRAKKEDASTGESASSAQAAAASDATGHAATDTSNRAA